MIGFFDSGLGGLTILKDVVELLPEYSYVYFGDCARAPYGSRSEETIFQFTREGIEELFKNGAQLIILACNTASASALRKIQQEWLPQNCPDKKVLGIVVPTAEDVPSKSQTKEIGILATRATVNSRSYEKEIVKRFGEAKVYQQACPLFVPVIEEGELDWEGLDLLIEKYLSSLFKQSSNIDTIILGCTHYAVIEDEIKKHLPESIQLISQGKIIAAKLKDYLMRHPEIGEKLSKKGERKFIFNENSEQTQYLAELFFGKKLC